MLGRTLVSVSIIIVVAVGCSSESDPGERCDNPGGTKDVCSNATVCGKPTDSSGALVCIPICFEDKDCPKESSCKGVDGTNIKGCRFKN